MAGVAEAKGRRTYSGEVVEHNPSHIWIEPTNRCNTRCVHCGHYYEQFGHDMEHSLYEKIREEVLDDVERAELIGYGEPFMAKHFDEMFDECVKRDIEVYTTSNGILLRSDERVAKLVRTNTVVCLSIEGARAETHEFVRPYIKWHKMIETLDCLKRNADAAGEEKRFRLRLNFCAMKQNIGDLPDLVRLAAKYGACTIFVLPLGGEDVFSKVKGQSLNASPEIVSPVYLEALEVARRVGVDLQVPGSFRDLILAGAEKGRGLTWRMGRLRRRVQMFRSTSQKLSLDRFKRLLQRKNDEQIKAGVTHCNMPWNDAYFAADGTVFPCCIMGEKLGDMKTQPWKDIWNGKLYRNLRRTVHSWNPASVCRHCTLPTGINGGDERRYDKFFSKFVPVAVPLDDPGIDWAPGFHTLERQEDGSPTHAWMSREGVLTVPMRPGAKFIRLELTPRCPAPEANPGSCSINGGEEEFFDNSCRDVHFPIDHVRGQVIRLELKMEDAHSVPGDDRELALCLRGIRLLC